jgi:hypothetical protein
VRRFTRFDAVEDAVVCAGGCEYDNFASLLEPI